MKVYEAPDFDEIMFDVEQLLTASVIITDKDPDEDPDHPWSPIF